MNNIVCKPENQDELTRAIKSFKQLGFDVRYNTSLRIGCYYGVDEKGYFDSVGTPFNSETKIVTLWELELLAKFPSELTFPREMMVSNNKNHDQYKRLVLGIFNGCYHAVNEKEIQAFFENTQYVVKSYAFAEEIPETVKMTLEQIEEKLGHKIEIIK